MAIKRLSSVGTEEEWCTPEHAFTDPVRLLRMAWFHLGTQQWHHSPHSDLQACHDFLSDKLRECQRKEEHVKFAVKPKERRLKSDANSKQHHPRIRKRNG